MSVDGDAFTMTQDCSFGPSNVVCKESAGGSEANYPGSSTETYTDGAMWVMATAGVEKLLAASEATPTASGSASASASASANTRSAVSETLATAAHTTTSNSASGTPTAPEPTGAAAIGVATMGRALFGAAAGLLAGLYL
jgi:hypothetical protein